MEEPIEINGKEEIQYRLISDILHVMQLTIDNMNDLGLFLKNRLKTTVFQVAWFYSAAFVDDLHDLDFAVIVYNCLDELSLFKGNSESLIDQKNYLLSATSVVFTGGK